MLCGKFALNICSRIRFSRTCIPFFLFKFIFIIYLLIYFIHLFLAVLGLCCCEWGLLFVMVHRLLVAVASLVAEHGL